MAGLLLRVDHDEHVIRSVGDAPNGILCMIAPEGVAGWAIDASWVPQVHPAGQGVTLEARGNDTGMGPASTPIGTEDLVAGLDGLEEAQALMQMMLACLGYAVQQWAPRLNLEFVRSHVDLALETRDALAAAGYLSRPAA